MAFCSGAAFRVNGEQLFTQQTLLIADQQYLPK
jgi:hypothetical protein